MKKLLIACVLIAIAALNVMAFVRSGKSSNAQEPSTMAKPLRMQLKEVPFVLLPAWFKV